MDSSLPQPHDEGLLFVLDFLRREDVSDEEKAMQCKQVIDLLMTRVNVLKEARGITHFALGGLIHGLKYGELWRKIPDLGSKEWWQFGDFCQAAFRMTPQKANALARIWEKSQKIGLAPEEIERIGWNCSQQLIRVADDPKETQQWLDTYDSLPVPKKENFIAKVQETAGKQRRDESLIHKTVVLTPDEAKFYDETIEAAALDMGKILGVTTASRECVAYIFAQWRMFVNQKHPEWREKL